MEDWSPIKTPRMAISMDSMTDMYDELFDPTCLSVCIIRYIYICGQIIRYFSLKNVETIHFRPTSMQLIRSNVRSNS